jgi:hypothetical protein
MELVFDVPIAATGRPEKYKTERLVIATVPVVVDIEECSRDDFKPAVSVSFDVNSATRRDFRSHAGRLYLPLWPLAMVERSMPLFELPNVPFHFQHASSFVEKKIADDRGWNRNPTVYPPVHREDVRRSRAVKPLPLARMAFETLDHDAIGDQIAMFERRASRLLCVDGMVHVQVSEPVISVTRSVNNPRVFLVRPVHRPFHGIRRDKRFPEAVFRIADAERAADFCRSLGAETEPLMNFQKFRLDVHDPEILAIQSTKASVYACARNLVHSIGVGSAIDNHVCSELLRELTRFVGRHNELDCPEELCDCFASLVDAEKSGMPIFNSKTDFEVAALIAGDWDSREITFAQNSLADRGAFKP